MILLSNNTRERAIFRILTMPEGTWANASGETVQSWTTLPVPAIFRRDTGGRMSDTVPQGGYHVASITRWCIPDEDRAEFYIDTGTINGVSVTALDLSNKAIRIQVWDTESAPGTAGSLSGANWKTIWAGTVIYQKTVAEAGATNHARTTYYCAGVLWRTRKWPLDRHNTLYTTHAKGHPGYNIPLHGFFRRVLGNKSRSDIAGQDPYGDMNGTPNLQTYYIAHELPLGTEPSSLSESWTDEQVIRHALASSRAFGEPLILTDLGNLFSNSFSWPVNSGDSCWDLLRKICNRQRGRGSVYLTYDDQGNPSGPLRITLKSTPSFAGTLVYRSKASDQDMALNKVVSIDGASDGNGAIDVDINGDHRVVDGSFNFDNRLTSVYDYIDVQGEPIQVLANLNFFGASLGKRWSAADETAFGALQEIYKRTVSRWRNVWRRFGIPTNGWDFNVTGEPGGTASSIDYYLDEAGAIQVGALADDINHNSHMTIRIMPDLPIYEGWDYRTYPATRFDASVDLFPPPRMPPLIMVKANTVASGGGITWANLQFAGGWTLQMDDYGVMIVYGPEEPLGQRVLSTPALAQYAYSAANLPDVDLSNGFVLNTLNCSLGLELGSRVRISYNTTGDNYQLSGRRLLMNINGLHLWLGAPGCIWELDYTRATQASYGAGLKFQGTTPTILRDDRDSLSFIAALAWAYFGSVHNPAVWSLNDCGFLSTFTDIGGKAIAYPALGQLVGKITYSGSPGNGVETSAALNTPITCIHYDHDAMTTTWHTDYVDYDGNLQ